MCFLIIVFTQKRCYQVLSEKKFGTSKQPSKAMKHFADAWFSLCLKTSLVFDWQHCFVEKFSQRIHFSNSLCTFILQLLKIYVPHSSFYASVIHLNYEAEVIHLACKSTNTCRCGTRCMKNTFQEYETLKSFSLMYNLGIQLGLSFKPHSSFKEYLTPRMIEWKGQIGGRWKDILSK